MASDDVPDLISTGNANWFVHYVNRQARMPLDLKAGGKRGGAILFSSIETYRGIVHYFTPAGNWEGNIQLIMYPRDVQGKSLATYQTIRVDLADTAGA